MLENAGDTWTRLVETTRSWNQKLARSSPSSQSPKSSVAVPPLCLASTSDAAAFLSSLSLPENVYEQASHKVQANIERLRLIHLKNYNNTCMKYINHPSTADLSQGSHDIFFRTVQQSFQNAFNQQITRVRNEFMKFYDQARAAEPKMKRVAFNPEYTPLFEKYFEYNAYPSARDREWLARKSMMTARQIEVWFQNHRARARKEGRSFQKLPMDRVPQELSLEDLEEKMSPLIVPKRGDTPDTSRALATPPPETFAKTPTPLPPPRRMRSDSILDTTVSPSHAFPAKYRDAQRLSGDEGPFPCRHGQSKFPAPLWYRYPARESPRRQTCTVDELCTSFSSMNLRVRPEADKDHQSGPWYAHRRTGPITAPHPSLIRPIPASQPRSSRQSAPRRSPNPRRQTPRPSSKRRRQPSSANRQSASPQPYVANKLIPRMASNSSLSSTSSLSDLETPESSPASSRAISLPAVHGIEAVDPFTVSSTYDPAASFSTSHWAIPQSKSIPQWQAIAPRQTYLIS